MGAPYGRFNILRVVRAASDDDQIFESPDDKKFAVSKKPEISRAKKRAFARIGQMGAKCMLRLLRATPVTFCDAWAGYPDLSHLIGIRSRHRLGIDNNDILID